MIDEGEGHPLAITCVEPYPFEKLHTIAGINVIARPVQDVDVSINRTESEHLQLAVVAKSLVIERRRGTGGES